MATQLKGNLKQSLTFKPWLEPLEDRRLMAADFGKLTELFFRAEASGDVFNDRNGDGDQGRGEFAMPNVRVELLDDMGNVVASKLTGRDGRFRFSEFSETGAYQVRLVLPTGKAATTQNPQEFLLSKADVRVSGLHFGLTTETATLAAVINPGRATVTANATADDAYEENDTFSAAANLGTIAARTTISSLIEADASDWYRFTIAAAGAATSSVSINFVHAQGDLDLRLYNARGQRLRFSEGITNSEQVSLSGLAAGTYYVRVFGYRGVHNPSYSLTVDPPATVTPPAAPPPTAGSGAFNIELVYSGLTAHQQAIFEAAAQKWETIIVGDLPNATYNGRVVDDLLISASATAIDGNGNVLGQAGPDRFRSGSQLPYHGSMQFDVADIAAMESNGTLFGVILHEMGHVLGIGTLWAAKGLLVGAGTNNPRYVGQQGLAAYDAVFGVSVSGVPVENSGGSGTRDAHWRESVFGNELMTGFVGPGTNLPLSRITVASLADLGYSVNLAATDAYSLQGASSVALAASFTSDRPAMVAGESLRMPIFSSQTAASIRSIATTISQMVAPRPTVNWHSAVDLLFADLAHELDGMLVA